MHPQLMNIIDNMMRNQQEENNENVVILESWCGLGQRREGVELGAYHLLQTQLLNHLPVIKINEKRDSNSNSPDYSKSPSTLVDKEADDMEICLNQRRVGSFNQQIAETISTIFQVQSNKKPFIVNIGGDHSVAIGSIYGMLMEYPDLRVLWVDAHADINTPKGLFLVFS